MFLYSSVNIKGGYGFVCLFVFFFRGIKTHPKPVPAIITLTE